MSNVTPIRASVPWENEIRVEPDSLMVALNAIDAMHNSTDAGVAGCMTGCVVKACDCGAKWVAHVAKCKHANIVEGVPDACHVLKRAKHAVISEHTGLTIDEFAVIG